MGDGGKVASQHMACINIAVLDGLDVILDDLAGLHREILITGQM